MHHAIYCDSGFDYGSSTKLTHVPYGCSFYTLHSFDTAAQRNEWVNTTNKNKSLLYRNTAMAIPYKVYRLMKAKDDKRKEQVKLMKDNGAFD